MSEEIIDSHEDESNVPGASPLEEMPPFDEHMDEMTNSPIEVHEMQADKTGLEIGVEAKIAKEAEYDDEEKHPDGCNFNVGGQEFSFRVDEFASELTCNDGEQSTQSPEERANDRLIIRSMARGIAERQNGEGSDKFNQTQDLVKMQILSKLYNGKSLSKQLIDYAKLAKKEEMAFPVLRESIDRSSLSATENGVNYIIALTSVAEVQNQLDMERNALRPGIATENS